MKLKRIAFKVPTERATKIRSPLRVEFSTGYSTEYSTCIQLVFNWQLSFQLASAKGSCSGLACRPTSRPREAPCREAAPPATSHGPVGCWGRARLAGRQRIKPNALRCRNARRRMQWSRQDKSSHMLSKAPNIAHKYNVSYFWDGGRTKYCKLKLFKKMWHRAARSMLHVRAAHPCPQISMLTCNILSARTGACFRNQL